MPESGTQRRDARAHRDQNQVVTAVSIQIEAVASHAEQIEALAFLHLEDFDACSRASFDQDLQFAIFGRAGESKVGGLFTIDAEHRDLARYKSDAVRLLCANRQQIKRTNVVPLIAYSGDYEWPCFGFRHPSQIVIYYCAPPKRKASVVTPAHLMLESGTDMNAHTNSLHGSITGRNLLALISIFVCAIAVQAQSGRRSSNGPPTTPTVSGPKTVEKTTAKAPKLQLLVGVEDRNPLTNVPYYLSDTVLDNCVRRLNEAAEINATQSGRGMTRADAGNKAKAEKEAYVVWLQIESDITPTAKQQKNGPDELYVRYTIFEPATARIKQWGRTHQQIYKTGQGGVSTSSKSSPLYSEYALKQAAKEAAERVLEAFEIKIRDDQ